MSAWKHRRRCRRASAMRVQIADRMSRTNRYIGKALAALRDGIAPADAATFIGSWYAEIATEFRSAHGAGVDDQAIRDTLDALQREREQAAGTDPRRVETIESMMAALKERHPTSAPPATSGRPPT